MMKWIIAYQIICLNLAYVLIIQHVFLKVWSKSWLSVALFRFWANTFTLFETQIPSAEKKCYKSYFTSWLDLISICDFEYYLCQLVFLCEVHHISGVFVTADPGLVTALWRSCSAVIRCFAV